MTMKCTRVVSVRKSCGGTCDHYVGRRVFRTSWPDTIFGNRAGTVEEYQRWFLAEIQRNPAFKAAVLALADGGTLGCWCAGPEGLTAEDKPWKCHGQVIAAYLDGLLPVKPA